MIGDLQDAMKAMEERPTNPVRFRRFRYALSLAFSAIRAALSACTGIPTRSPGHGHSTGRSPAARRATSVRTGEYYFDYEPIIAEAQVQSCPPRQWYL
jgi:hypothetical protein